MNEIREMVKKLRREVTQRRDDLEKLEEALHNLEQLNFSPSKTSTTQQTKRKVLRKKLKRKARVVRNRGFRLDADDEEIGVLDKKMRIDRRQRLTLTKKLHKKVQAIYEKDPTKAWRTRDVAKRVGALYKDVNNRVLRLHAQGLIVRLEKGVYKSIKGQKRSPASTATRRNITGTRLEAVLKALRKHVGSKVFSISDATEACDKEGIEATRKQIQDTISGAVRHNHAKRVAKNQFVLNQ